MAFISPELRENRGGELEAARKEIAQADRAGRPARRSAHAHDALRRAQLLEEMVAGGRELGHEYIAITDHSALHGFGDDASPDALRARIEEIRSLADTGIPVLTGTETNIMPDGTLDYDDDLLEELDWVRPACTRRSGSLRRSRPSACCARWSTRSST